MEAAVAWSQDTKPTRDRREERTVVGRIKSWGPFYYGSFTYVDVVGGGLSFVGIKHTRIGVSW